MGGQHKDDGCVLKADKAVFDRLETRAACIKKVDAEEVESTTLVVDGVDVNELLGGPSSTGITSDLDPVTCKTSSILGIYTPQYLEQYNIKKSVFDAMLKNAKEVVFGSEGLQSRLTQGRMRLGLPEPSKVQLLGSISFAPWTQSFPDDPSKSDLINYNTNLGWNLQCANVEKYIEGFKPNPSVVSVYIQYGYIDKETGLCKCELIDLGNKQLDPTIDYVETTDPSTSESGGEEFVGKKVLDTGIIARMYENMPDPKQTGGVQLLFFAEKQIQILRLNSCQDSQNRASSTVIKCGNNCKISTGQSNGVSVQAALSRVARRV